MGEVINRALRPLTVLTIIGAVAAFALVVAPGGKSAAAPPLYPAYSVGVDNVGATTLSLSQTEVRPNQSIIIRGRGFGTTPGNTLSSAQIGGVALLLSSHGGNLPDVEVSASGQFAAVFAIWPANPADNNPTLGGGTLEIEITDQEGLSGTAQVTILSPTLTITPAGAGPHQYVSIAGANWPAANPAGGGVSPVKIEITGVGFDAESMDASADANGKWAVRYRLPGNVSIPSTVSVQASYGGPSVIVVTAKIRVQAAGLSVVPNQVAPCALLTLNAAGFGQHESDITVKIGHSYVGVPAGAFTDRDGTVTDLTVIVPVLDAGIYTVQLNVGGTIASSEVTVLDEIPHDYDARPDALSPRLSVAPDTIFPRADLTLNAAGFARCESNITLTIGDLDMGVPTGTFVDDAGQIKDLTVLAPTLDAGAYIVQLQVGGAVAFSEVTVLGEIMFGYSPLPDVLAPLGNNLVRVFHFNNATKTWSFYDQRPEFAELNTLSALTSGEPYWIMTRESHRITFNGQAQTDACHEGTCWNQIVW